MYHLLARRRGLVCFLVPLLVAPQLGCAAAAIVGNPVRSRRPDAASDQHADNGTLSAKTVAVDAHGMVRQGSVKVVRRVSNAASLSAHGAGKRLAKRNKRSRARTRHAQGDSKEKLNITHRTPSRQRFGGVREGSNRALSAKQFPSVPMPAAAAPQAATSAAPQAATSTPARGEDTAASREETAAAAGAGDDSVILLMLCFILIASCGFTILLSAHATGHISVPELSSTFQNLRRQASQSLTAQTQGEARGESLDEAATSNARMPPNNKRPSFIRAVEKGGPEGQIAHRQSSTSPKPPPSGSRGKAHSLASALTKRMQENQPRVGAKQSAPHSSGSAPLQPFAADAAGGRQTRNDSDSDGQQDNA